jgi:DNA-binding MurR/RpiR family transcriptional regulator
MSAKTVEQRLNDYLVAGSKAERRIATFMLASIAELPFDTAASISKRIGVSEPTVGRFCRTLGYQNFKALKEDLQHDIGGGPWLLGDRLKEFHDRNKTGEDEQGRGLELEIASLVRIYELARTEQWARAVKKLARYRQVFIAGFQVERGLAQYFANQLQYLRPNVHLVDVAGGNFSDALLNEEKSTALVIFEARRYSRLSELLAKNAKSRGIPLTLITDAYCDWGHDLADEMFVVRTEFNMFWDSTAHMANLSNLLINSIFKELGPHVEERLNAVTRLHGDFIGYVGEAARQDSKSWRGSF